jgi:hypothetical protein
MIESPAVRRRNRNCNPGFRTYYQLGVEHSKKLDTYCTVKELGELFGMTHQNAHAASLVALGKLVFRLRATLRPPSSVLRQLEH